MTPETLQHIRLHAYGLPPLPFARLLGTSAAQIKAWEAGETIPEEYARRVLTVFQEENPYFFKSRRPPLAWPAPMSRRDQWPPERIKALRQLPRMPHTQAELAERLQVSLKTLAAWEQGHTSPRPDLCYHLETVLRSWHPLKADGFDTMFTLTRLYTLSRLAPVSGIPPEIWRYWLTGLLGVGPGRVNSLLLLNFYL